MTYIFALIATLILLLPGIFLALIPGIPGILYMLVIAAAFGLFDHFVHITPLGMGVLALIAAVNLLGEFLAGIVGAKWGGAHWSSILWGIVGLVAGSALIPIPFMGSIIGMFIGVLVSELYRTRDIERAQKAATGSFLGWLAGTGFKLATSIIFFVLFVIFALA